MADFKYILQVGLQLNTGSLKKLISDVGDMDKAIKSHYEKSGGGVRVPLSVDKDISKLQRDVKKVVEGYNNGQAPTIRIKVAPDESSITRLQARIEEVKKQLNSLSDDKNISINTSLKVGNKEKENIQRQVGETKATVVVGLRLNPDDIKKIQKQIEDVRAEVTAQINAVSDNDFGRRFNVGNVNSNNPANRGHHHHPTTSTGSSSRNIRGAISNRPDSADRFVAKRREILQEIKSIGDVKKAYDEEFRAIDNLEKYQKALQERIEIANSNADKINSGKRVGFKDAYSDGQKYFTSRDKTDSFVNDWKNQITKLDQMITLQKQYDAKLNQLNELERRATYGGKNATKIPSQHPLAQLNAENDAKAKLEEAKANASKKAREQYLKQKRLRDQRTQKDIQNKQKGYIADQDVAEKLAWDEYNKRGRVTNPTVAFNQAKTESKYRNSRIMYPKNAMNPAWDEYHERLGYVVNPAKAQIQAEKEYKNRQDKIAQENLEKQWKTPNAFSQLPANGKVAKLISRQQKINDRDEQRSITLGQAKSDFDNGIRKFGPQGIYSGKDWEAMLANPNISYEESMNILKNKLHPFNQRLAVNGQSNFQKQYGISFKDEEGNIRQVRTLTYQYTKLGEVIEKGDKGFSNMMEHITSRVGIYSVLEGALAGVSIAIEKSVTDMARFDAQLADVIMTTKNLSGATDTLQQFYGNVGGTSSMESQVQNDTFKNAETYGVSGLDTVMPIEQQVIARHDLVSADGGKTYNSNIKDQIVQKIMQFSAISTGGNEDPETTNELTQDLMSLYQAYYNPNKPTQDISKMNGVLDFMTGMKTHGVNTTAIANATAELAPDTLTAGIDTKQVMASLGAYNLADASATGNDIQTIGRTFFGSLRHASSNGNIKSALQMMGLDLNTKDMNASDLMSYIFKNFGNLTDPQKEMFAQAFSGTSGQSKAMVPKMVKFLDATQGSDYKYFTQGMDTTNAMQNAWGPFSTKLKTQFDGLVEKLQEFVQLIGRLGVLDGLGGLVKVFSSLLGVVNSILRGVQSLSDVFSNNHWANIPKITLQIIALTSALKGMRAFFNNAKWGGAVGDYIAGKFGGRTFGIKRNNATGTFGNPESVGSTIAQSTPLIVNETAKAESSVASKAIQDATMVGLSLPIGPHSDLTSKVESVAPVEKKGNAVGRFFNDAFMVDTIRKNGGVKATVGNAVEASMSKGKGIISAVVKGFGDMLPMLRGFMLLLTQITVIGGALTLAFLGTKAVIDEMNKEHSAQVSQQAKNVLKLQQSTKKNPNVGLKINSQVNDLIAYKQTSASRLAENARFQKYGVSSSQQVKGEANSTYLQDKFNIQYHRTFGGKNDYVTYMDQNKKTHTAHIGNGHSAEMKTMNDFFKNGGVTDVQKVAQAWQDSTSYLTGYNEELAKVSFLQQGINENMTNMATQQKAIQAQFAGVDSTASDSAQASALKKAMDASTSQITEMQGHVGDLQANYQMAQSAFNGTVKKALRSVNGLSQSDITQATSTMSYAMQNPTVQTPDSVLSQYNGIDLNTSEGMKEAKQQGFVNKKGKIVDQKGLDDYNNKMSAMQDILQIFQTLFTFQNNYTQGNDQLSQLQQQNSQNQEQYKQLTSQSLIASTGINTLSASLSKLNAVAQATSALVQIATNPLQNGDNHAQISAISTSAQVAMTQMANLQTQSGSLQSSMNDLIKNNPNQDFSLNQLYNPSGEVSAQQLAYKSMYESKQQVDGSIANQSTQMYQMYSQMRDLVLSSNQYADVWQRIQDTISNIKDDMKNLHDTQFALASVDQNAQLQATFTGQDVSQVRQQQLTSIRDNSAQLMQQATTNMYSVNSDNSQYQSAMDYITKQMGSEFQDAMIDPLKSIVSSATSSNNAFAGSVSSFSTAVSQFQSAVNQDATNSQIAQQDASTGAPPPSSSNYQGGATTGADTSTGRTLKLGFNEGDYGQSLGAIAGGKYKGDNMQDFVYAGSQYNVDPNLLMSIAMAENSGSSNLLSMTNNVGSIKAGSSWKGDTYTTSTGTYRKYASLQDGINDLAKLIAGKIGAGDNTIPKLNADYAQSPYWMNTVADFMAKATNTTVQTWLGNATSSSGYHLSGNDGGDPSYTGGGSGGSGGNGSSNGATTTSRVHLRSTPSTSGKILSTLPSGQTYKTYGEQNGWVNVGNGWVSSQYLTGNFNSAGGSSSSGGSSNSANGGVQSMFNWLNSVKGNTKSMSYVWGGGHVEESWSQFLQKAVADCSGLVENVYKQFAGINLGTTTAQGIYSNNNGGVKVSNKNNLQEGDLLFFGSDASHITHTGIYAGNGQMYSIDNTGLPVRQESMSMGGNYVGGKHFNIASSGAVSTASASIGQQDSIISTAKSDIQSLLSYASDYMHTMNAVDMPKAQVHGNIQDVLGTSGVTARYDRIIQARQDINDQMISNVNQMNEAIKTRNQLQGEVATSSGDQKTTYQNELDATNQLISALQTNTSQLQALDATYASWQQNDPRLNLDTANGYIHGGLNSLNAMQGQGTQFSVDYFRKASEIGTMNNQYMTAQKQTDAVQGVFDNYGEQATQLSFLKGNSDQNNVNIVMNQIGNMNDMFKTLATGTQQWWSTLNEVAQVQQKLHDLEQQRLQDAQTEFNLTGQGLQGLVDQRAYTQSKQYSQDASNVKQGISQYQSGNNSGGYGLTTGTYLGSSGANKAVDYLKNTYGITSTATDLGVTQKQTGTVVGKGVQVFANADGTGKSVETLQNNGKYTVYGEKNGYYNVGAGWVKASSISGVQDSFRVSTDSTLSSGAVNSMGSDLKSKGMAGVTYSTGGNNSPQDFNQQLATLQTIADSHNQMIQQMNDYKQAVTDAFTAGALSVNDYMSKLNKLRDTQTEMKQSAVNMINSITSGFQSSLSQALSQGMQGALNSPLDFMNSIKQTLSGTISDQLSSVLLNNTGLQDVMNKITSSITSAATSGDPSSIANMFENNDFGKQLNDALAPFLPMIQQIVGSTNGIFSILQNQTFNAPSGFKVDNYMNEVANSLGYQGIKNMNPNTNGVGSPINSTPSGSGTTTSTTSTNPTTGITTVSGVTTGPQAPISTTAPSQTPTGVPTTTSGSGATSTGSPQGTTGSATSAPSTAGQTSLPDATVGKIVTVYKDTGLYASDSKSSKLIKMLYHGQKYKSYGEKNHMINLGGGWADGTLVYHTGGIAGVSNFSSGQGLKPNELQAILQKEESIFQPAQLSTLINGAMQFGAVKSGAIVNKSANGFGLVSDLQNMIQNTQTVFQPTQLDNLANGVAHSGAIKNNSDSGLTINVNVNIDGGANYDQKGIESVVETAVQKAMSAFKKNTKMNNLTWKGTSY